MAQPGNFTPILLYGSSTPTNVPLAANLTNSATGSEIAINVADKNLFFKDSGGVVNTVPIRQSSTSSNGWLSSTDWNTFNGKAPATSGTSILYGNGTGGFSNVTIGSGISFAGGTLSATGTGGTVTSVAALTLGTTGTDLSSTVANGATTPVITLNVPTASAANRGALSAADWSTFNGKQAALVSGTNIKTVGGVTLLGSGDVGTIGTGYGGTGLTSFTSSGVVYASSTSALTTGSGLLFNGTFVGVGITPSSWGGTFAGTQYKGGFAASQSTDYLYGGQNCYFNGTDWKYIAASQGTIFEQAFGAYTFYCLPTGTAGGTVASFPVGVKVHNSTGVSIGNTTDPGAGSLNVNGNLNIGQTTAVGKVNILYAGTYGIFMNGPSGSSYPMVFQANGTGVGSIETNGTVTTYNTVSDYRLKENVAPMTDALAIVSKLKPVTYTWKSNGSDGQGFIAHELAEVVPDCVSGKKDAMRTEQYEISPAIPAEFDADGKTIKKAVEAVMGEREVPDYQGIDTSFLAATLTAAIQEQQQIIITLQAQVTALQAKVGV